MNRWAYLIGHVDTTTGRMVGLAIYSVDAGSLTGGMDRRRVAVDIAKAPGDDYEDAMRALRKLVDTTPYLEWCARWLRGEEPMSGISINDLKYALDEGTVTVGEVAGYLAKHTSALIPSHGEECSCATCVVAAQVEALRLLYYRDGTHERTAFRESIAPLKEERDRARSERDAVQRRLDQERSDWAQKMGAMEEAFKERERALQHQVDELARKRQFRREETGDLSNTAERTCLKCGISDDNIVTGLIPVGKRGSYWCFPCLQDEHE